MLKKRLGTEAIEVNWGIKIVSSRDSFKIPPTLIIPEGCKKIGWYAFYKCDNLREVVIPEGIKRIGEFAFFKCEKLENVVIPESVEKIDGWAFEKCKSLREVIIPESVEEIGDYAFWGCSNATIILKKPMSEFKKIGKDAFRECKEVRNI